MRPSKRPKTQPLTRKSSLGASFTLSKLIYLMFSIIRLLSRKIIIKCMKELCSKASNSTSFMSGSWKTSRVLFSLWMNKMSLRIHQDTKSPNLRSKQAIKLLEAPQTWTLWCRMRTLLTSNGSMRQSLTFSRFPTLRKVKSLSPNWGQREARL